MSLINKISTESISWINIINPEEAEMNFLRDQYNFHPLNLEDASVHVHAQRPKIDIHEEYLFLILHFPIYNSHSNRIKAAEVNFFIGKNYLITMHDDALAPLRDFYKMCREFDHYRHTHMSKNPSVLLYEILDRLLEYCFPIMDHIGIDIEKIEDGIFEGKEKEMVKDILLIKRNITDFRKIMQSHKTIIKKLITMDSTFFPKLDMSDYYDNLIEQTKDIWAILNTEKETIDAIHETNESALSFELNDIMKTLTIFSVLVFPLTLVAAIFGMNTQNLPFIGVKNDFWMIIGIMIVLTFMMFAYFKSKKWL